MNEEQAISRVHGILLRYGIDWELDLYVLNLICKKTTIQLTHEQTANPKSRSGASPGGENNDVCRHTAEEQTEAQGGQGAPCWSCQGLNPSPGGSASTLLLPSPPGV